MPRPTREAPRPGQPPPRQPLPRQPPAGQPPPRLRRPAGSTPEEQLAAAIAAYNGKNYALALKLFEPLANQGNSEAQVRLGYMYLDGQGVAQDYSKAYFWFSKAADQDNAGRHERLGIYVCQRSRECPRTYKKAFQLYLQAAEKGNVTGTEQCGRVLRRWGRG